MHKPNLSAGARSLWTSYLGKLWDRSRSHRFKGLDRCAVASNSALHGSGRMILRYKCCSMKISIASLALCQF